MERRLGVPKTDVERAMSHYNISEQEYLAHPGDYPLPARGSGFQSGAGLGGLLIILLLIFIMARRK